MLRIIILIFITSISVISQAYDSFSEILRKAIAGDSSAQSSLGFQYGHWSSPRFSKERSNYWYCRSANQGNEEATINLDNTIGENWKSECKSIIENGNRNGFNKYFVSGQNLGKVKLSLEREASYEVPLERYWRVEWAPQSCEKVCKSDIKVEGQIYTSDEKNTAIYGDFELNAQKENSVIWLFPETKIQINISGANVNITEYAQ
ncbi:hypothetical protein [Microbulbifer sp. SAOS-129_SWC]|uniref:hypothetical protein n=1 Tax=Microbulbifer sp. SAOS-129_SWC TaxID=3145235 RepID=UPI003216F3B8